MELMCVPHEVNVVARNEEFLPVKLLEVEKLFVSRKCLGEKEPLLIVRQGHLIVKRFLSQCRADNVQFKLRFEAVQNFFKNLTLKGEKTVSNVRRHFHNFLYYNRLFKLHISVLFQGTTHQGDALRTI